MDEWVLVPRRPTIAMAKASRLTIKFPNGETISQWGVNAWRSMLAAAPLIEIERVRHVKSGTKYEVLGEAEAQIANPESPYNEWTDGSGGFTPAYSRIHEGDKLTVYRDPKSGKLWCRFTDEFRDGRFVTFTAAPATNGDGA